ncbi:MAG: hypothetical protein ACRD9W_26455, partial [Terriglobia bacterium]
VAATIIAPILLYNDAHSPGLSTGGANAGRRAALRVLQFETALPSTPIRLARRRSTPSSNGESQFDA